MKKAYSSLHVKAISDDGEFVHIEGIASSPKTDRDGDVVLPMGAQFQTPMPLLLQHKHDQPVGQVYFAAPNSKGIPFKAKLPIIKEAGKLKERVDEAIHSLKHKLLGFVSIGFSPIEGEFKRLESGGYEFKKWNWHELSIVTIPAQPDAVISMVKSISEDEDPEQLSLAAVTMLKSYDGETHAASGKKDFFVARLNPTAGASASNKKSFDKPKPLEGRDMNIQEQIKSFRAALEEKKARAMEIMGKSAAEGRTLDQSESEEYDTLEQEIGATEVHLKRLESMEKSNMENAKPIVTQPAASNEQRQAPAVVKSIKNDEPGIGFARFALAMKAGKGDLNSAKAFAETAFAGDVRLQGIMKAAVAAGTTTSPTWAGNLVDYQNLSAEFVEFLRPRTIVGQFGTNGIPALRRVPFNVRIPGKTSAGSAAWVGEGYRKKVTSAGYDAATLKWSKIAAISVLTEELERFSDPSIVQLTRDDLAEAVIERMDIDFVDPSKAVGTGATESPASITNGVTPIVSTATTDPDAIRAEIAALWAVADDTNLPTGTAVYITDAKTARALTLLRNPLGAREFPGVRMSGAGEIDGVPLIVSNYVPGDSSGSLFILAFASEIYLADDGQVNIDISREATIFLDDAAATATPTAAQLVSMFQTNQLAVRAERYVRWQKRRPQAVAYLSDVDWV